MLRMDMPNNVLSSVCSKFRAHVSALLKHVPEILPARLPATELTAKARDRCTSGHVSINCSVTCSPFYKIPKLLV